MCMTTSSKTPLPALFDPAQVPVWQEATSALQQQRAIAAQHLTAPALQQRFLHNYAWQVEDSEPLHRAEHLRAASVLIGLQPTPATGDLHVVLTQRPAHLRAHAGQIAFPGGKVDEGDAHAVATALREAHEEVGLPLDAAQVLGTLPEYSTSTGFVVTPVVALLPTQVTWHIDPSEVAEVFTVPLAFLMNPAHHRKHQWVLENGVMRTWYSMPATTPDGKQRYIWGVTAAILRNFYHFLAAQPRI